MYLASVLQRAQRRRDGVLAPRRAIVSRVRLALARSLQRTPAPPRALRAAQLPVSRHAQHADIGRGGDAVHTIAVAAIIVLP